MSEIELKPCPFCGSDDVFRGMFDGEIDHADCFVERIMKAIGE